MDGWMDEWIAGCMHGGWVDGQTDREMMLLGCYKHFRVTRFLVFSLEYSSRLSSRLL